MYFDSSWPISGLAKYGVEERLTHSSLVTESVGWCSFSFAFYGALQLPAESSSRTGCGVPLLGFQCLSWGLPTLTRNVTSPPACSDSSSPPGLFPSIATGRLGPVLLPEPSPPNKGSLFYCLSAWCQTHSSRRLLQIMISALGRSVGSPPLLCLLLRSAPPVLSSTLSPSRATQAQFPVVFWDKRLPINLVLILSYHQTFWRMSYVRNCLN